MPRLIDSSSRADSLTLAINHVIATDGVSGLSLRRIGQVSRVSAPTIVNHFGSRARLLQIAASRTARDRLDEFVEDQPYAGLQALLPHPTRRSWCTDPTVHARVWLGWLELWRSDPDLQQCLAEHHDQLRSYVGVLTEGRLDPLMINALLAVSEGLQSRMAAPVSPLSPADADVLLLRTLDGLGVPVSPVPRGTPIPQHLSAAVNWMRYAGRGEPWRPESELADAFRFEPQTTADRPATGGSPSSG